MDDPARNRAGVAAGVTIDDLASLCDVTTRTIRRDLQALEEAGFPLFDDRSHDDGRTRWRMNGQAFRGLAAGLTLSELCALLLQSHAGLHAVGDAVPRRRRERVREARAGADAAHAPVSRSAAARHRHQARCARSSQGARRARSSRRSSRGPSKPRCTCGRRRSPTTRNPATGPSRTCSTRTVLRTRRVRCTCSRTCLSIRRVRTFAIERVQTHLAARGTLHADRGTPDDGIPTFARRPFRPAGARRDCLRRGYRGLCRERGNGIPLSASRRQRTARR